MKLVLSLSLAVLLSSFACASAPKCPEVPVPAPPPIVPVEAPKAPAPVGPLIFDGTPDIPTALKSSLLRYLEARSASVVSIADDGKALLVATRLGTTSQIYRVDGPGSARTQVTFEAEPVSRAMFVPKGEGAFWFTRDTGGNENFQLYRTDRGGKVTLVSDGTSRHGSLVAADDGARIAFNSNKRNGKDFDVWTSDGKDPASAKLVIEVSGQWSPLAFSPDGKALLAQEFLSIEDQRLHLIDLASGTAKPLTTAKGAYRDAIFSKDGKRLFVTTDKDGDFVELQSLELATNTWKRITSDVKWNVESLALSSDGKTLALVLNEDGNGRVVFYDAAKGQASGGMKLPFGIASGVTFARSAPKLAFNFGSSVSTGDAYVYDFKTKDHRRWTESEIGGLDEKTFVEAELVRVKSFDGTMVSGFYYRPRGEGPFPVVINIHGGPESQSRPSFSPLIQYLVTQSKIAVLVPNVRGSDGYGKAFLAMDNGRLREDSVKDIGAFIDWIGTRKELDAKKVAVMGGSYGGYMVLACLVHFGDRLVAGIDVVGISSFVTFLENTAAYRRDLRRAEYGDESDPAMREFLNAISPLNHVDKIKSALFVVHGANDPRVPLSEAEQVVAAVRKNGREAWKLVAMNEGHGFAKRENRDAYMQLAVMFLEKHLAR